MKNPTQEELLNEAAAAAKHAYCPYSKYRVGAALLTSDGRIFRGCNVENASYGLTVCAERIAFFAALAVGHREFTALAIVSEATISSGTPQSLPPYPCGACRQVMAEFCGPDFTIYAAPTNRLDAAEKLLLGDLLPKSFKLS